MTVKPVSLTSSTALVLLSWGLVAAGTPPARAQQVDRSTPHTQNGLTLIAVARGNGQGQYPFPVPANLSFLSGPSGFGPPGGIGLWVRGVAPAHPAAGNGRFPQGFNMGQPTASAQGTGGETLPVQCQRQYTPSPGGQMSATPLYLLSLPGGYPDGYGPVDVSMDDSQGHHAHWRLGHLPPSYHAITGAVATRAAFSHGGVTLRVRAWRDRPQPYAGFNGNMAESGGVWYRIDASLPAGSQWAVRITKTQLEWEALRPGEEPKIQTPYNSPEFMPYIASFGPTAASKTTMVPAGETMIPTPYGAHDRYLRLTGQIVQIATAQETLTFHNLSVHRRPNPYANYPRQVGPNGRPLPRYTPPPSYEITGAAQTAVTPSGISVTLLSPSSLPQSGPFLGSFMGGMDGGIQMLFKFNGAVPGRIPVSLPSSPLAKKYHKPVAFEMKVAPPFHMERLFRLPGYFARFGVGQQEYTATVSPAGHPNYVRRMMGNSPVMLPTFTPQPVPPRIKTLTFNISQRAELKAIPVSFLVPIGNQAPPSLYPQSRPPQFQRRGPMLRRPM